ncbi:MAG TPA: hypothetical protein VFK06_24760 [Candidatus Angelobacter sp.]|nr:hypothetical protein [Candidatus Angelobacter sp.]
MQPRITVYKNLKTGIYYVQPHTIGPVAATWFGEPTVIFSADFRSKIGQAVLSNLEKFGTEKYDPARSIRRMPDQQMRFLKENIEVIVLKCESGGLTVCPLRREKGGRVGHDDDVINLTQQELPHKLADAIAEAFNRAT